MTVSFTFLYLNPPGKEPSGHEHIKIKDVRLESVK